MSEGLDANPHAGLDGCIDQSRHEETFLLLALSKVVHQKDRRQRTCGPCRSSASHIAMQGKAGDCQQKALRDSGASDTTADKQFAKKQ